MSEPSTSTTLTSLAAANALKHDSLKFEFQQTVPSAIVQRNGDLRVSSVCNSVRGSRNRTSYVMVEKKSLPGGWRRVEHPDSGVFYVNKGKSLSTPSNMLDLGISTLITQGADALRQCKAMQALKEVQEVHLVLDVRQSGSGSGSARTMCYYCVSHTERDVFWLEDVGLGKLEEVSCTSSKCPKGSRVHCIQAQYWKHCELFPTTLAVTKDIISELKNVLLQASADRLLVKFSTSPYDKDNLAYMLNLVEKIEGEEIRNHLVTSDAGSSVACPDVGEGSGHSAWIIAKFMALYIDGVFQSSYGQSDDFFDIDNTGPSIGPYQRHRLLTILALPFLKTPNVFAFELHSFRENFDLARWSDFVRKVDQSIRDSNLIATVLLGTNMGFLSWCRNNGVTEFNNPNAAQIVSYISIICSVGSIVIGLSIFKQYRATGADTPLRAVVVLRRILKESLGLERLAIICSLPYVLLMWSLIAFLVSFAIIFYQNTGIDVRIPVTLALFIVLFSLFFCMHTTVAHYKEEQKPPKPCESEAVSNEKETV